MSEARRGGDVWDAQPWDGNAAQTDRQTHTHTRARTHTKPETKDNPKKDSLCLDDSTQLITVSPLSVASPSCRCCRWQRRERLKVTHRGPPPPLPRAARHPPPPLSPGERRSLLFSSPLPLTPSPPVLIFSAEGVRSRLPLPSPPRRSRRPRCSPPPRPDLPAPLRSPPGTLREGGSGHCRRGQPARPRRLGTPGGRQGGGLGVGGRSRREESGVRGGNKKTFHPGFSTSDPWTEPNSANLQTGYKQ